MATDTVWYTGTIKAVGTLNLRRCNTINRSYLTVSSGLLSYSNRTAAKVHSLLLKVVMLGLIFGMCAFFSLAQGFSSR